MRAVSAVPGVSRTRIAFASFIGTAIEFYDFYIYGTAAALLFGKIFFPSFSPVAGTLASLATFGVGFVARPIGAVLFGHLGDRMGRKRTLVLSLLLMGVSTFAVGLIPSYNSIGVAAPALLVIARLLQGLALGGEWGGAVLLATEYAPANERGRYSSYPQMGPAVGFIASSGLFFILDSTMSPETFATIGWRIPFLLSAVLVAVGYFIRVSIAETPVFQAALARQDRSRVPFADLIRNQSKVLALATVSFILAHTVFYTVTTFSLSYGTTTLHISSRIMLIGTLLAAAAMGVATPLFARLSDNVGRKPLCVAAAVSAGVWAFPMFLLIDTRQPVLIWLGLIGGLLCFALLYGPMGAFLPELFHTRYRYSGASFAYSASGIVGGGISPLVATEISSSAGSSWPVSLYLMGIAAVAAVCIWALPETKDNDFGEVAA